MAFSQRARAYTLNPTLPCPTLPLSPRALSDSSIIPAAGRLCLKFCGALDLNEIQQLGKNEKATGRGRMWEKKRNWCCLPDHLPGFLGAIGWLCSHPCGLHEGHCIQICSCLRHARAMQECVANGLAHAGIFRRLCAA